MGSCVTHVEGGWGGLRACARSSGTCKRGPSPRRASYRPPRFSHLIYVNPTAIAYPANHRGSLASLLYVLPCYS